MGGLWLPDTCEVAVSPYCVHRNAHVFDEPDTFNPSRWLVEDGDNIKKGQAVSKVGGAFGPFSIGPRSYVGKRLGMVEVTIVAVRILLDLDFQLHDHEATQSPGPTLQVPDYVLKDHHNAFKKGSLLRFFRAAA